MAVFKLIIAKFYEVVIYVLLALLFTTIIISGWYYYKSNLYKALYTNAKNDIEIMVLEAEINSQKKQAEIDLIKKDYEYEKENIKIRVETVTREIEKFIDRPVYNNVCIDDDGLQKINSLISNNTN